MRTLFIFIFLLPSVVFADSLPDFVSLTKKVNPAVVNIQTKQIPKDNPYSDPMQEFLEQFYGMYPRHREPIQSLGSGFIIDKSGLIITNNHVVDKADEIDVQLSTSEKTYKAKVIGKDARTDIALIKIDAKIDLPILPLGSSDTTEVGEWVAAFGSPLGFTQTVTKGIISGKGRSVEEIGLFPFLQTDASVNPGNSGGPLVNLKGEAIGVNTFIIQGASGLSFATPIDGVKQILGDLKSKGKVIRGYIGLAYSPLDPRAANYLGLKDLSGVIVGDVYKGGPADKAGIKPYDVIVKFGETEIKSPASLQNAVAKQKIGSKVEVKILRDRKEVSKKLSIELPPDEFYASGSNSSDNTSLPEGELAPYDLGFRYSILPPRTLSKLGIPKTKKPVILSIEPGSPARQAGLARGDIILDINRKNIRSMGDVKNYLRKGSNLVRVQRGNYRVALFIEG
ncbi:MAG: trypsin-like peptidase domain-containing protein [Bdellovibrionales bacterium]|nr:trypsin-like peptidase domain-containing protein [Bdellovibrionales bacterium]